MIQAMCVYKTSLLALALKPYLHFCRKESLHAFTRLWLIFFPESLPGGHLRRRVQLAEKCPLFLMTLIVIMTDEISDDQHRDAESNPAGRSAPRPLCHLTPEDSSGLDPPCHCCRGRRCCCCLGDGCQAAGELLINAGGGNHWLVLTRGSREGEMEDGGLWDGGGGLWWMEAYRWEWVSVHLLFKFNN